MKPYRPVLSRLSLLLVLAVTLTACDVMNEEAAFTDEEEVAVTSEIIAQALSDKNDGLMASLADATADVQRTGLSYSPSSTDAVPLASADLERPWRDRHRDYEASYDPETGVHTIQYRRSVETPRFSKSLGVKLEYIFQDSDGAFLEFPRRQREDIATITFNGKRVGQTTGKGLRPGATSDAPETDEAYTRSTSFDRETAWVVDGLAGTEVVTVVGRQQHVGTYLLSEGDRPVKERRFTLILNTDDVEVTWDATDAGIEYAVTGTIDYQMTVELISEGASEVREHEGTIELSGDGTALLRFSNLRQAFRIGLAEGTVDS